MLFTLSIRNAFRHRGRLLLTMSIVMVASLLLVIAVGQIGGINRTLTNSVTDTLTGHINIKPQSAPVAFFEFASPKRLELIRAEDVEDVIARVSALPMVEAATPRIKFGSLIGNDEKSIPAMIIGVDPGREGKVCTDLVNIVKPLQNSANAVLASYLANRVGIQKGENILVFSETADDSFNAAEFKIDSTIDTPVLIDEFINSVFLVDIQTVRDLLYLDQSASEISIRLKPGYTTNLAAARDAINQALTPAQQAYLKTYTYQEVEQSIEGISGIAAGMGTIQVGTIMLIMLVTVLIITSITLHERRFEIGALMSIGMSPAKLTAMFVMEVGIKVVLGYVLGAILGFLILQGINFSGGIKAANQIDQYIYGGKVMFPIIDYANIALGMVLVVSIALLITLGTCIKASRQDIVGLLNSKK